MVETGADFTDAIAQAVARLDPGLERRLDRDPQAHLDLIVVTRRAQDEIGTLLSSAVVAARAAGHSWEQIGSSLGMSRQAAQQRFGRIVVEEDEPGDHRRLVGLTAMREMEELDEWGRHGWHSVRFGPMFHDVERSSVQWEHRRNVIGSRAARELEQQGWQRIGTLWFPWVYFKRMTGKPAEPGEPGGEA